MSNSNQLVSYLMPNSKNATRNLVRSSCLNRLKEWTEVAVYLASQNDYLSIKNEISDTMEQFRNEPDDFLFRRLSSPIFRGWLSMFGGVKKFSESDSMMRFQMSLWNNMRHSFFENNDYNSILSVIEGHCLTYDPWLSLFVGPRRNVNVLKANDDFTISCSDTEKVLLNFSLDDFNVKTKFAAEGCMVKTSEYLPDSRIVVRNDLPLLHLKLSGTAQRDTGVVFGALDHSKSSYPEFDISPFQESASILNQCWSEEYSDFQETLQAVIPRGVPNGWRARGMTVSSYQGAIWIMAQGLIPIFEHMVHEQSHVKLRYIEESNPILEDEQTSDRFIVGWRKDPRPIIGIYEGVYVHLHVVLALMRANELNLFPQMPSHEMETHIDEIKKDVKEGLDVLVKNGRFTSEGATFISWAEDILYSTI